MVDELRRRIEEIVRQVVAETMASEHMSGVDFSRDYTGRKMTVAANWKMNGSVDFVKKYLAGLRKGPDGVEVVICPPAVLLCTLQQSLGPDSGLKVGVQDLYHEPDGAFTGEHSASMLKDGGAEYAIVGHSERRTMFGESDEIVHRKLLAALDNKLRPILCVGESLADREAGATFRVLRAQLTSALGNISSPLPDPQDVLVAYEPLWAIGTGRTATALQAQEAMSFIRDRIGELFSWSFAQGVRILYGGSAKPENAYELASMQDVDGFLVGGAGLDPEKLISMAESAARAASEGVARA